MRPTSPNYAYPAKRHYVKYSQQHIDILQYVDINELMKIETQIKAINNPTRLKILEWLKRPEDHFPPHESGLGFDNGVCVAYIQEKTDLSQSATSQYMSILHRAGFVIPTRIGKWTYYKRNEEKITQFMQELNRIITLTGEKND
jgi:ArsR family transcriptional regulator